MAHEVVALRAGEGLGVVALVGPGNNGGDALAAARQLHGWGIEARAVLCTAGRNAAGQQQEALARAMGVPIDDAPGEPGGPAIVLDGLLGTGSQGAPRGTVAEALAWQRAIAGPRVAIDVPSGVDVDTGAVSDPALVADLTVTFVRSKPGLHVTPGRAHAGRVVVADIGIVPPPGPATTPIVLVDPLAVLEALGARPPAGHKGQRGHVVVLGGSETTPGAAVLAATTALRAGAGLVTVVTGSAAIRDALVAHRPELDRSRRPPTRGLRCPAPGCWWSGRASPIPRPPRGSTRCGATIRGRRSGTRAPSTTCRWAPAPPVRGS